MDEGVVQSPELSAQIIAALAEIEDETVEAFRGFYVRQRYWQDMCSHPEIRGRICAVCHTWQPVGTDTVSHG